MTRKIIIFGAGGHAVSVANVALSADYRLVGFIDVNKVGSTLLGYPINESCQAFGDPLDYVYAIAIGDNFLRSKFFEEVNKKYPEIVFPSLVHSSAVISNFTRVGSGSVVMPLALVGPNTEIQKFCIINSNASIDHDGAMGNFSSLAPGAILGGSVSIGERSAISIGAVIKHSINVGSDSVLGANSYLNENLGDCYIAYGNPAKIIRQRVVGERYL